MLKKKTNGMIKNLIDNQDINETMFFVLVNTVYFKASWENKFDVNNTTKMRFHKTPTNMVNMMHQINYFNYFENNILQALELPYDEKDYVMGIILPKRYLEEDEMNYSANNVPILSLANTNEIINNMQYTRIDLYLPKFTQKKNIELVPILKKMGITDLFNNHAELDIIEKARGEFVSKIIHESVVIVDEIGTEASAATVVLGKETASAPREEPKPKLFKADHAFIYYIRHIPSGLFLFYGDYQGK